MKIAVAQARPIAGDIARNADGHQRLLALAVNEGVDLVVFPELSLTGYEPALAEELAMQPDDPRLERFQEVCDRKGISIGIGLPVRMAEGTTISLVFLQPGEIRKVYSKAYLHADEEPYFVAARTPLRLSQPCASVAPAICFELSVPAHADDAARRGADTYLASVAKTAEGVALAHDRLKQVARQHAMVVLMANAVGHADNTVCAGGSAAWGRDGMLLGQLDDHSEGILVVDTEAPTAEVHRLDNEPVGDGSA